MYESDYLKKKLKIKYIDEVNYCCEEMKQYYESHNIKFVTKDEHPHYFYKMLYEGKTIEECPFCGAEVRVERAVTHWGP